MSSTMDENTNLEIPCMISDLCHSEKEIFALLEIYTA
jgi:hypothetical protein